MQKRATEKQGSIPLAFIQRLILNHMMQSTRKRIRKYILSGVLIAIILSVFPAIRLRHNLSDPSRSVSFWLSGKPYSADPLEFDSAAHHEAFGAVFGTLINQYRLGHYTGVLAENWNHNDNFKEWRFRIRKEISFENGDLITAQAIRSSWIRSAFLQKRRKSESGFFEKLEGYENINSPTSEIDGIKTNNEEVVLRFKQPFPKLLDIISFGLYGIVHPSDFNPHTGEWKNPKKIISSGPYRISNWTNQSLTLSLREEFLPTERHSRPLKQVELMWDADRRRAADLVSGDSLDSELNSSHKFFGAVASTIAYIHCLSWSISRSVCHDIRNRRALRESFYKILSVNGVKVVRSFFPTSIVGVSEVFDKNDLLKIKNLPGKIQMRRSLLPNALFIHYNELFPKSVAALGMGTVVKTVPREELNQLLDPSRSTYSADVSMLYTGILVNSPEDDIRFMFLSKEGIRLPDTDGRIQEELKKPHLDVQKINEILINQAVIWPIEHYATGVWAKDDFDFSELNLILPPTDLRWIGFKK